MRSANDILDLILNIATSDACIRAVIMGGSRANPNTPRNIFQDFDIVYFVTEVNSFTSDHNWINQFGEMMILQMPEEMGDPPPINDGRFAYLMQFTDGNRIDLTLFPLVRLNEFKRESLSLLLLDKDDRFESFPAPDESDYLTTAPTSKAFADCCNEFWWVSTYVAKGLWREEIIYAKHMLDQVIRIQMMKMLTWYAGMRMQFRCGVGNHGRYLKRYLEPELWAMFEKTYSDADFENTWDALFMMCQLFRIAAKRIAEHFGFNYPSADDDRVSAHLKHVRGLPSDASEIY